MAAAGDESGTGYECKAGTADGCDRAGRRGTRHARAVGSAPEVVPGCWRCGAGSCWGRPRAATTKTSPPSWGAIPRRRPSGAQRFAERRLDGLCDDPRPGPPRTIDDATVERVIVLTLESHAGGRDALVDAVDGQSSGHLAVVGARHLAGVRSQAPPHRGFQAVPGPAVHRQGPRRRGAVPQPPRGRGRCCAWTKKTPDPGRWTAPPRSCR